MACVTLRLKFVLLVVTSSTLWWLSVHPSSLYKLTASSNTAPFAVIESRNFYYDQPTLYTSALPDEAEFSYLKQCQPSHFEIKRNFILPFPETTISVYKLLCLDWMDDLRTFLTNISNSRSVISLVSANTAFEEMLLNWLISATIKTSKSISNILVLALDSSLHKLLQNHRINSVFINSSELLRPKKLNLLAQQKSSFYLAMIARMTVMRLLNHWGYDVANYDADAVIFRNPEELYYGTFNSSDLIGSIGKFPEEVYKALGLTLCAGVFMIRSTNNTGKLSNIAVSIK